MKNAVKKVLKRVQRGISDHCETATAWPTVGNGKISKYEIEKFLGECLLPFLDDIEDLYECFESESATGGF